MDKALIILAVVLTVAAPALGEPAKRNASRAGAQQRALKVMVASADAAQSPTTVGTQLAAAPLKRPVPRVTTCRCGDPQADSESPQQ
jgi:hypothetical protein